jgi:hypothetical protein
VALNILPPCPRNSPSAFVRTYRSSGQNQKPVRGAGLLLLLLRPAATSYREIRPRCSRLRPARRAARPNAIGCLGDGVRIELIQSRSASTSHCCFHGAPSPPKHRGTGPPRTAFGREGRERGVFSERTGGQVVATNVALPWRRNRRARACATDSGGARAPAPRVSARCDASANASSGAEFAGAPSWRASPPAWRAGLLACLLAFDVGVIRARLWPALLVATNAESQGRRNSLSVVRPPARERGVSYSEAASEGILKGIASIRSAGRRGAFAAPQAGRQDGGVSPSGLPCPKFDRRSFSHFSWWWS